MAKYPIYLEVGQKRVVVVGSGAVAIRKAQSLLAAGARVVVISRDKRVNEVMLSLQRAGQLELIKSAYSKEYLGQAVMVIAATGDRRVNKRIYQDCQELEILCNVVDDPELCDFYMPAIVKRQDLQIAIGTEGDCPAYAGHLRKKIEQIITAQHGAFLKELEEIRKEVLRTISDQARRTTMIGRLVNDESFKYFRENGADQWRVRAQKELAESETEAKE